ncbi:helix-turn-helix transcriptional regulator [Janibacter sp. GXQ6167]|uniref:helix-turn-helix transcriptional regulator n=1 Tax=Janibacter sp. GXQ6167 TaxID=3240791 RepID=UPI00352642F4
MSTAGEPTPGRGTELLRSAVRRDIVDTLANLPEATDGSAEATREIGLSAADIGASVGLHLTTARFHLDQLVSAGVLESHFLRTPGAGRPRKLYRVAPGSLAPPDDPPAFKALAEVLADSLAASADGAALTPEEAGRRWAHSHHEELVGTSSDQASTPGGWMAKIGVMVDVLHEWGYTPELSMSDGGRTAEIELRRCPFIEMARDHPQVVCAVHRGLMRGVLEASGEEDVELSLEPFVNDTTCMAHVTTRATFAPRGGKS